MFWSEPVVSRVFILLAQPQIRTFEPILTFVRLNRKLSGNQKEFLVPFYYVQMEGYHQKKFEKISKKFQKKFKKILKKFQKKKNLFVSGVEMFPTIGSLTKCG